MLPAAVVEQRVAPSDPGAKLTDHGERRGPLGLACQPLRTASSNSSSSKTPDSWTSGQRYPRPRTSTRPPPGTSPVLGWSTPTMTPSSTAEPPGLVQAPLWHPDTRPKPKGPEEDRHLRRLRREELTVRPRNCPRSPERIRASALPPFPMPGGRDSNLRTIAVCRVSEGLGGGDVTGFGPLDHEVGHETGEHLAVEVGGNVGALHVSLLAVAVDGQLV